MKEKEFSIKTKLDNYNNIDIKIYNHYNNRFNFSSLDAKRIIDKLYNIGETNIELFYCYNSDYSFTLVFKIKENFENIKELDKLNEYIYLELIR